MAYDYDVIVLGGGSAGPAAAAEAHRAGARTAMINEGELGGLCILRGCMPTKAMLASAEAVHCAEHLEPFGARLEGRVLVDFDRVMQRKNQQVDRFQRSKIEEVESTGYELVRGRGRFAADGTLDVDGRRMSAGAYVIATGSVAQTLPIPGIDRVPVLVSDDVMRLTAQPRSLLVQGAGPIGLELAQFFARIGTEVVLVNRSRLCSRYDTEAGDELSAALAEEPRLELAVPGTIEELRPAGQGLEATICVDGTRRSYRADALLMAVGRRAALEDIGLEHLDLLPTKNRLEHDPRMRTANPRVWVAGDATGRHQILHLSKYEGRIAGYNAAGGSPARAADYRRMWMQIAFTDPPFAQFGVTEEMARSEDREIIVGRARFPKTGRAITMGVEHGIWKLIADRRTGEILGTTIVGPRADDLVHTISVLALHGGCAQDLLDLPWYHPTLSEVMMNLARDLQEKL